MSDLVSSAMPASELRLHFGEMSTDEMLTCRSAIRFANAAAQKVIEQLRDDLLVVKKQTRQSIMALHAEATGFKARAESAEKERDELRARIDGAYDRIVEADGHIYPAPLKLIGKHVALVPLDD